jgi:HEAT repeat protein
VVAAVAAVWGYLTVALAPHYIDLFRQTLRQTSRSPKLAAADWDIDALESVMAALNSVNDQEVRAALKLLHEEGRERVVPALLLYHPSPSVVVDASQILAKAGRKDVVPILDRLLFADTRAEVLTPLLRARGALGASETLLRRFVEHADPRVSVTALAQLVAHGLAAEDDQTRLRTLLETGSADVRLAMTDALALQPLAGAVSWIAILARDADKAVRMSALQAIVQDPQPQYLDALVGLLGERDFRADARAALVTLGEPALEHLSTALQDERRSILERRHIPRTVLRFDHPRVPAVLASRLGTETDPLVHYKLLRALDGLRARGVELSAYNDVFEREAHKAVHEIATWHAARMALQRSVPVLPVDTAELHDLLVQVLLDERQYALYRLFLALALRYPKEDMTAIARGLASDQGVLRASSRELLEAVLGPELRQAILQALDASDTRPAAPPPSPERVAEYLTLVAELSASSTRAVSNMASAVAGELTHVEAVTAATAFHAAAPSASGPVGSGAHGQ